MSNDPNTPPSAKSRPEPQLLRFHLRHLFLAVTFVCVLCGVMVSADGAWPMVIGGAVLLVGAHILGNLLGTRLRDSSEAVEAWNRERAGDKFQSPQVSDRPLSSVQPLLPPSTPLATKQKVAHWTVWFVAGGLLVGLIAGGYAISITLGADAGWPGWLVGTVSCGVLGAWAAFLISTFSSIARHAWRHADRNSPSGDAMRGKPAVDSEAA